MKRFQKALVSCALGLSLISPARSAVGVSFAAPAAVVAGVATMAVAAGGGYGGYRLIRAKKPVLGGAVIILSLGLGYFGLLLLDGEQSAKFAELTPESAANLGITQDEMDIYNSEIEQVNAVAREVGAELVKQKSESVDLSRELWIDLGLQLSPETMKTVIAIAGQQQ